jgi:hypothetical protein
VRQSHSEQALTGRFNHVRTFHPYLEPFSNLLAYTTSTAPDELLLISTVIYLSSLSLPNDDPVRRLRGSLIPYITLLRDRVLVQLPSSFSAIQALELFSLHAPLGVLPLQDCDPRSLGVARGQHVAMSSISISLNFPGLIKTVATPQHPLSPWECSEAWLWFAMCCLEASIVLEDEVIRRPASLQAARELVDGFLDPSASHFWRMGLESKDPAELIGRLCVADRLSRLGEIHDSLERLRHALETAAQEPHFDPVDAIIEDLKYFARRLERLDQLHDAVLGESCRWICVKRR